MVEVDKILKYAEEKGAQEAEVMSERSHFNSIRFELGEPRKTSLVDITEYALRVVVDGSVGFSYFTGKWKDAVAEAVSLAKSREKDEKWRSFASDTSAPSLNLYRKSVEDVPVEQIISDMEVACEATEDERIVASNVDCLVGYSTIEIANSSGVSQTDADTITQLRVMCRAAADDYGMGYSYAYSLEYDIDFFSIGEQAKEKALSQLGKEKTESGDKNVILVPKVFSSLLVHAALPSFLGHNVVEGRSSLQIGQEVASHSIQVTENPLLETPLGRRFDDEGVPSQKVELLQDGCVRAFLYDTYYGETTSNGVRYARYRGRNLRDPPKPSATSLVVTGEPSPLDDIISEVSHGLLVVDETNSHASKTQSGLFSIAVTSGFIINHGEILAPVKRCMISGLAFEDLLPGITSISKERELHRSSVYPTYVETGHALVDSLRVIA